MKLCGLPTPVFAGTTADLGNRIDKKPSSRNRNLRGVECAIQLVGASSVRLNSGQASSDVGISANRSLVYRSSDWG